MVKQIWICDCCGKEGDNSTGQLNYAWASTNLQLDAQNHAKNIFFQVCCTSCKAQITEAVNAVVEKNKATKSAIIVKPEADLRAIIREELAGVLISPQLRDFAVESVDGHEVGKKA